MVYCRRTVDLRQEINAVFPQAVAAEAPSRLTLGLTMSAVPRLEYSLTRHPQHRMGYDNTQNSERPESNSRLNLIPYHLDLSPIFYRLSHHV